MEPVSLIISKAPMSALALGPAKGASPHVAVVYVTPRGEVDCFEGRPMTYSQQAFSKYRTRFEVDMRDHQRTVTIGRSPLVSRDQVHAFEVVVTLAFRVDGWDGAKDWVRSGLPDALPVVYDHINHLFHGAGQGFDIEDSFGLQQHLNRLCGPPRAVGAGLLVHGCRVNVRPDAKSREFLEGLVEAAREERTGAARHVSGRGGTHREIELRRIQQEAEIAATRRQSEALNGMLMTSENLIRQYLVTHPQDAAGAVEMMRQLEEARSAREDLRDARSLALFQLMADKGLVLPGDLNDMRRQLVGQVQRATGVGPAAPYAPAVSWDAPLALGSAPPAPAAHAASAPGYAPTADPAGRSVPYEAAPYEGVPYEAAPPRPGVADTASLYEPTVVVPAATPHAPTAFPGAALIYLVLDESLDSASLDELNRGLRNLHDALSASPEVAARLRICVVGMAAGAELRLPLEAVGPGTRTPILMRRPGLSYREAFRTLRTLLPQDVALVKAEPTTALRPMVFFVSGGTPGEGGDWQDAHDELVDRSRHPSAPHIVACGLAAADPRAVQRIATRPEFGHMAAPNTDAGSAAHSCAAFLRDAVVGYGRRLAAGSTEFSIVGPDGFRPAADTL
ncbi:hypothetical protein ACFVVX_25895 [Kitasatospora sp. NPDC058170]|uniref:vWA domain-containing protein n=1 Tax=Kitasatospora sp. NPDC058170 TaxID=3346364 RepID=UPI0036D991DF